MMPFSGAGRHARSLPVLEGSTVWVVDVVELVVPPPLRLRRLQFQLKNPNDKPKPRISQKKTDGSFFETRLHTTQAFAQEMYASTTSSVVGDEDVPALQADIVTTSYGHDFEHRHPDGPSTRCNWAYILDEVR